MFGRPKPGDAVRVMYDGEEICRGVLVGHNETVAYVKQGRVEEIVTAMSPYKLKRIRVEEIPREDYRKIARHMGVMTAEEMLAAASGTSVETAEKMLEATKRNAEESA